MGPELLDSVVQVDVTVLAFVVGTVMPLLTALFTKMNASSGTKAVVNLVLSVVAGVLAYLVAHDGSGDVLGLLGAAVAAYMASGVSYQNLWKPTGVSLKVQQTAPAVGVGGTHAQVAPDTDQA